MLRPMAEKEEIPIPNVAERDELNAFLKTFQRGPIE